MPALDGRGNRISYNGQEVYDVLTKGIEETVVYDASNTDRVATQVAIEITGLVSARFEDDSTTSPATYTEGYRIEKVIKALNEDRKWFIYWVGDQPHYAIWPVDFWDKRHRTVTIPSPGSTTVDFFDNNYWSAALQNGPKIETSVISLVSDRTARISMKIEFVYIPCKVEHGGVSVTYAGDEEPALEYEVQEFHDERIRGGLNIQSGIGDSGGADDRYKGQDDTTLYRYAYSGFTPNWVPILSNRWRVSDNINTQDWLCTRTFNGKMKLVGNIQSQYANDSYTVERASAHYFRYLTMPPVQYGFKRQSLSFDESEDGKTLEYTIQDKQVYIQPPWPACDFEATSSTSIKPLAGGMGSCPTTTVNCRLTARKHIEKRLLLQACTHVLNTKTNFLQTVSGFKTFPTSLEISETMHANTVEAKLEVLIKPDIQSEKGVYDFVMKYLTKAFGQGSEPKDPGHLPGDHDRGLTSKTIPQTTWGAGMEYHHSRVRFDLQYPDDMQLLGPLSNIFLPYLYKEHGLKTEGGDEFAEDDQLSWVGNEPCEGVATYNLYKGKLGAQVGPITRFNYAEVFDGSSFDPSSPGNTEESDIIKNDFDRRTFEDLVAVDGSGSRNDFDSPNPTSQKQEGRPDKDYVEGDEKRNSALGLRQNSTPYINYEIKTQYEVKNGREFITSANPKFPLTFFHKNHHMVGIKTYKFFATRIDARPVIPLPEDFIEPLSGIRHLLLTSKINIQNGIASASGDTYLFGVSGTLIYCMERPYSANEPIFTPSSPDLKNLQIGRDRMNFVFLNSSTFASLGSNGFLS